MSFVTKNIFRRCNSPVRRNTGGWFLSTSAINYQKSAKRGVSLSLCQQGTDSFVSEIQMQSKSSGKKTNLATDVASPPLHTELTKLRVMRSSRVQVHGWKMGGEDNPGVKPLPKFNNLALVSAQVVSQEALAIRTRALAAGRECNHPCC